VPNVAPEQVYVRGPPLLPITGPPLPVGVNSAACTCTLPLPVLGVVRIQ